MAQGWISLHRKITQHPFYREKRCFSKFEAWVDLLLMANHRDNCLLIGNTVVDVKRGSKLTSIKDLSLRWQWSRTRTKNFLDLLQNHGMISYNSTSKYTLITIENYSFYQPADTENEHQRDINKASNQHQKNTNNNVKNVNNVNKKNISSYSIEFEEFWKVYPRRVEKLRAFKCYNQRLKEGYSTLQLLKAAQLYSQHMKRDSIEMRYIKHCSTFLGVNKPFLEYLEGGGKDGGSHEESPKTSQYDKKKWLYRG